MTTLASLDLTKAALAAVLDAGDERMGAFLAVVRADRSSRALDTWRNAGGGTRRQYLCTRTGRVIDSESARYARTKHAADALAAHTAAELARIEEVDPELVCDVLAAKLTGVVVVDEVAEIVRLHSDPRARLSALRSYRDSLRNAA